MLLNKTWRTLIQTPYLRGTTVLRTLSILSNTSYNKSENVLFTPPTITKRSYAKPVVHKKKEQALAWYLPQMDEHPSKYTDYLNLLVFELAKLDRRAQVVHLPRHNAKYRYDMLGIKSETDIVTKPIAQFVSEEFSHHMPIITTLVTAIDLQYQHTKSVQPNQSHESAMLHARELFTQALQEQTQNVEKKKDNDVEKKFLSHIHYLRGKLLLEGKLDRFGAEEDFLRSIELGNEQTLGTPFRAWYPLAALGSLLHRNFFIRQELYQNDVAVPYPQNEEQLLAELEEEARRAAEHFYPKPIAQAAADDNEQKRNAEYEKIWNSERFKTKREQIPSYFENYKPYEGAGEASESLNGERVQKPQPPSPFALKQLRDKAYECLNLAVQLNENFTEALIERGWFLINLGRHYHTDYLERALADLTRAIEFEGRLSKPIYLAWYVRTIIYMKKKDYRSASDDIDKVMSLAPRSVHFIRVKARVQLMLKKYRVYYNLSVKGFELLFRALKDERRERQINRRLQLERNAMAAGEDLPEKKKRKVVKVVRKIAKKESGEVVNKA